MTLKTLKKAYPPFLINKVIKKYFDYEFSSNQNQSKDTFDVHNFKIPYIGNVLHRIKNKLSKVWIKFWKDSFNIQLAFNTFKIKNYFPHQNPIPHDLKSFLAQKITCPTCSFSSFGETCRHFKTRI